VIDLIFLSHNRREFTEACLQNLIRNTNWDRVNRLILYDDNSTDGRANLSHKCLIPSCRTSELAGSARQFR
jgi:GT2 family glycosyltransferase